MVDQAVQATLEKVLFLLGKFCVGDDVCHELSVISEDMPRSYSYLIKQLRSCESSIIGTKTRATGRCSNVTDDKFYDVFLCSIARRKCYFVKE